MIRRTIYFPDGRRLVAVDLGVCSVCDGEFRRVRESRRVMADFVVCVHGPRSARCAGSRQPGKPFLEASRLPGWDQLSDHDKCEALMFAHKINWEQSYSYARNHYPPRYVDPRLSDLPESEKARHASAVVRSLGTQLESVENPFFRYRTEVDVFFARCPRYVREPLVAMARRVLGEQEFDRLLDAGEA